LILIAGSCEVKTVRFHEANSRDDGLLSWFTHAITKRETVGERNRRPHEYIVCLENSYTIISEFTLYNYRGFLPLPRVVRWYKSLRRCMLMCQCRHPSRSNPWRNPWRCAVVSCGLYSLLPFPLASGRHLSSPELILFDTTLTDSEFLLSIELGARRRWFDFRLFRIGNDKPLK
jgi:hypothetical protein